LTAAGGGRLGVVLPGEAFKIRGAARLRELLVIHSRELDIQMCTNKGRWLFDAVDPRKLVAFLAATRATGGAGANFRIHPEVHDMAAWTKRKPASAPFRPAAWLRDYSPTLW
jgi:hypothetical protein